MFEKQKLTNNFSLKSMLCVMCAGLLIGFLVIPQAHAAKGSKKDGDVLEQEITVTMPIPSIQFTSCEAYISFESHQRNMLARVASTIEQKTCKTATGEYELLVTIKDGNGVLQTLTFSETWEQKDDSQVEFSNDYPIGENVTLKRVMARNLRCECSDE